MWNLTGAMQHLSVWMPVTTRWNEMVWVVLEVVMYHVSLPNALLFGVLAYLTRPYPFHHYHSHYHYLGCDNDDDHQQKSVVWIYATVMGAMMYLTVLAREWPKET